MSAAIVVRQHAEAGQFLRATAEFRAAEPLLTNVMGSVATGVLAGRRYDSELWLTLEDADGRVIGMAMRTAPWNLSVSPMPADAAVELGRFVAQVDPALPGVSGPESAVHTVVDHLNLPPARRVTVEMVDVVRVLRELKPPRPCPGTARLATTTDKDLLIAWHYDFGDDAGLPVHGIPAAVEQQVAEGRLWLWTVDREPVAMAGHAPLVDSPAGRVGRIGPVFTPDEQRRHGYGAAVTAAVTAGLVPICQTILLFADAAKPENNRLYQRLGFEEAGRIVEVSIGAATD